MSNPVATEMNKNVQFESNPGLKDQESYQISVDN